MYNDIESLLNKPMPKLKDINFSKQVMANLVAKEQSYLKFRRLILLTCLIFCFVIFFVFSLTLSIQLIDLSKLFLDSNSMYMLLGMLSLVVFYIGSETLEGY